MNIKKRHKKRGVALLLSVLILSIVLSVSLTLLNAVVKQQKITIAAEESVLAIYAADTGIECALMWDIRGHESDFYGGPVFKVSIGFTPVLPDSGIFCAKTDISSPTDGWVISYSGAKVITTFQLNLAGGTCAIVEVEKEDTGLGKVNTQILSRGYNVACSEVGTSPIAVERALLAKYIFTL